MLATQNVILGFSEEHVQRLSGLSRSQLRYWDRTGFFQPAYAADDRKNPYSRIYSFRDVVGLKTLGILRNKHKVPLQHLRQVAAELSHLRDELWTRTTLYVLNKRVVLRDTASGQLQDAVTGQYVLGLPLKTVISDLAEEAKHLRERPRERIGRIERNRYVSQNAWVIAGTRITTRAIKYFSDEGYSAEEIMREYPDLTEADIAAALEHEARLVSAA